MRISLFVFTLLFSGTLFFACNNAAPSEGEEGAEVDTVILEADSEAEKVTEAFANEAEGAWNATMDAYHEVMADVFHSAEEGDMEPLKNRYQELAKASEEWAAAEMPDDLEGKGVAEAMKELVRGSAEIAVVVESGSEEEMTQAITDLHDSYHKVVGLCNDHEEHAEGEKH